MEPALSNSQTLVAFWSAIKSDATGYDWSMEPALSNSQTLVAFWSAIKSDATGYDGSALKNIG
jgi:hypothetical protein